jgi:hypothetical protein
VEKQPQEPSATLWRGSIDSLSDQPPRLFQDSSTGTDSIPSL